MVSRHPRSSPSSSFLDLRGANNLAIFKTPDPKPHPNSLGRHEAAGDPQGFTCPSRAVPASSKCRCSFWPSELRSSTRRTGSPLGICRVTWGQDAADGGVVHSPSTRGWSDSRGGWAWEGLSGERERWSGRISECFILLWPQPLRKRKTVGVPPPETGSSCLTEIQSHDWTTAPCIHGREWMTVP